MRARIHTHVFFSLFKKNQGFPGVSRGKESSYQCRRCKRHRCIAWVGKMSPGIGNGNLLQYSWVSPMAQQVKYAPQSRRHRRRKFDPGVGKTPWRRKMATHSSILVWKIPWTEKPVHRGHKEWTVTKNTHERSLLRENSHLIFWRSNIFHMWRTAIKFRLSREWSDGEMETVRALEGWRERRSRPVSGHQFCPSLDTWGGVVW